MSYSIPSGSGSGGISEAQVVDIADVRITAAGLMSPPTNAGPIPPNAVLQTLSTTEGQDRHYTLATGTTIASPIAFGGTGNGKLRVTQSVGGSVVLPTGALQGPNALPSGATTFDIYSEYDVASGTRSYLVVELTVIPGIPQKALLYHDAACELNFGALFADTVGDFVEPFTVSIHGHNPGEASRSFLYRDQALDTEFGYFAQENNRTQARLKISNTQMAATFQNGLYSDGRGINRMRHPSTSDNNTPYLRIDDNAEVTRVDTVTRNGAFLATDNVLAGTFNTTGHSEICRWIVVAPVTLTQADEVDAAVEVAIAAGGSIADYAPVIVLLKALSATKSHLYQFNEETDVTQPIPDLCGNRDMLVMGFTNEDSLIDLPS